MTVCESLCVCVCLSVCMHVLFEKDSRLSSSSSSILPWGHVGTEPAPLACKTHRGREGWERLKTELEQGMGWRGEGKGGGGGYTGGGVGGSGGRPWSHKGVPV